jgi:hypothetical protein
MPKRRYIDLTPKELLARRYVVWGLGFFALPPLLTSCHFGNYLCRASWNSGVSPLATLWTLFPWMLPIAIAALGGLGMVAIGATLLLTADLADTAIEPAQGAAFRICVGSLFAILLAGGFGYFLFDAIFAGFYFAQVATERVVWLVLQISLFALYFAGALLALSPAALRPHAITVNR